MDLFEHNYQQQILTEAPLAARMRPRTLDEFVGQDHIIAPGRLLRRAIAADQLSSLIFFGPPGTGKTTLARIIANTTIAHFIAINAVLAGVKDIRDAISTATDKRKYQNQRTILFVDEVHRFNKSQQDALLPWVENGTVILIGATTENPYFEVNKALVSRSRIFQLKPLEEKDLRQVVTQTLTDPERGYGQLAVQIEPNALEHLVNVANGDARSLLNALELAVETTPPDAAGVIHITLGVAEESIQQRAVLYDKEGDAHFDTISAYIKSIRGSDPDAALYWLARMLYAGEDPRFILRRLLIQASEDIGLADPQAVVVINACAQAFDRVGMPEGRYHLAQATLYLANAPKSNSVMGFFDALATVEREFQADIPNHLKDANRDKQGFGHGAGYLYPHAYRDHWVEQQYLPKSLQGQVFYQPSEMGKEAEIKTAVARRREAQLAAAVEGLEVAPTEVLTYGETNQSTDRWLQRTLGQVGQHLAELRDTVFHIAAPARHHIILDLNAASGLLTWEAVRRVPEGSVYACVHNQADAQALAQQAATLPELVRPIILNTSLSELPNCLANLTEKVKFDRIIGRNVLMKEAEKSSLVQALVKWLNQEGMIVLAETVSRHSQRLYNLLNPGWVEQNLYEKLVAAEEAIYSVASDHMVNWDVKDLRTAFEKAGLAVEITQERTQTQMYITPNLLNRWFTTSQTTTRPSYATRLAENLKQEEVEIVKNLFHRYLLNQTVNWNNTIAIVKGNFV
ncbi:MAG: AAA family ATPase [Scytonema hyalinum WJT4-NPBG1]|jgi:putative ATPase|nr:AAA family ATPase [Scytonema hyalinum WJT4-NPBG1]